MNENDRIHIGKPLNNTRAYILDKSNKLLPVGVIGELAIGGIGVSKGYRNMPELTAEKFIKNEDGEILYKTGDLGRFLEDGNIELFGRADNQIKLRGFRIEPGEIETQLTRLPNIKEAVVKLHRFEDNDDRLVAFLIINKKAKLTKDSIVKSLSHNLPHYMIPSFFQMYDDFPRLPNGKVNKKELVFDEKTQITKVTGEKEVLTSTEEKIFDIWSTCLKTKDISVSDNFFSIGGNSLMAISVSSKVESAFNIELGLRVFFDSPKIKDLAEIIDVRLKQKSKKITKAEKNNNVIKMLSGEI
jgi:long-subunit acyl-CoA synthetase (AMP-forming)